MLDFVITADESCMHNYNMSFMAGFVSCVPRDLIPDTVKNYIEKKFFSNVPHENGVAELAILALRKVEAYLSYLGYRVVVCPPQEVGRFKAKIYIVSTMDPFGTGPATTTMVGLAGGKEPFNKFFFRRLIENIKALNTGKIIVGGPGVWEFGIFKEKQKEYGIDCVFNGTVEAAPKEFWDNALNGQVPESFTGKEMRPEPYPIKGASFWGMVEISRGCGRGCQFCDIELMSGFKWLPIDFIVKEAELNAKSKYTQTITLLSEDTLRYGTQIREWKPNGKIVELVKQLAKLGKPLSFTHCCLATALANPKVTEEFAYEAGLSEKKFTGFQTGIESGSPRIVEKYMQGKLKPWEPDDWPDVVRQGMAVMVDNYIIPHATLVMGLKEEAPEDTVKTLELIDDLYDIPSLILPLFFVPLSILKDRSMIVNLLTQEQKDLLALCSKHTAKWSKKLPNWSGSLGLLDKFAFTLGANWCFNYLDAVREGEISKARAAKLMTKSFGNSIYSLIFNNSQNLDEYYKYSTRNYPIIRKIEEQKEEPLEMLQHV